LINPKSRGSILATQTGKQILERATQTDRQILERAKQTGRQILERATQTDTQILDRATQTGKQILERATQTDRQISERAKIRKLALSLFRSVTSLIPELKGQCHEIFRLVFFMNQFPPSP
jgi:hypothetical protein